MATAIDRISTDRSRLETAESTWKSLYRMAGVAALITLAFMPVQIVVFIAWPPPGNVIGWFTLFRTAPVVALIDFDLLLLLDNLLAIPVILALYCALRRVNEAVMALAVLAGLAGCVLLITARPVIEMVSLSDQYASAATNEQRTMLLAAGQAMLALYNGTAFNVSYIIGALAMVAISAIMLRSAIFSKATAYAGILANVIGLGLYIPTVGQFLAVLSVPFLAIWYVLIARRLFQLSTAS
jgi:hypothetical protein